jgi:hypothetical protein
MNKEVSDFEAVKPMEIAKFANRVNHARGAYFKP